MNAVGARLDILEVIDCFKRKRELAINDANASAVRVSLLHKDAPRAIRVSFELVERMYSHNVAILDEVLHDLKGEAELPNRSVDAIPSLL